MPKLREEVPQMGGPPLEGEANCEVIPPITGSIPDRYRFEKI